MDLSAALAIMPADVRGRACSILVAAALDNEFPLSPHRPSDLIGAWMKAYGADVKCPMMTLIYLRNLRAADAELPKKENFSALTLCATFMVAHKFTSNYMSTSKSFADFFKFKIADLNRREKEVLNAHRWNVFISEELWATTHDSLVKDKTLGISEEYLTQLWECILQPEDARARKHAVNCFCEQVALRSELKKRKRED